MEQKINIVLKQTMVLTTILEGVSSSDLVLPSTGVVGALPRRQAFSYEVSAKNNGNGESTSVVIFTYEQYFTVISIELNNYNARGANGDRESR